MTTRITFINHATTLLEFGDVRLLTDPVFCFAISYWLPRFKPPGITLDRLPAIDAILLSHNHYDHLNFKSLRALRKRFHPIVFVPRGDGPAARRLGFSEIRELEWGESSMVGSVRVHCVPARHVSGRTPWSRGRSLCCGYVIRSSAATVYFAGDTAYGNHFREIAGVHSPDAALLPIGAYKPHRWFEHIHLNPHSALQAFRDLGAAHFIPIHWGTFKISDEPLAEPPAWLLREARKAHQEDRVHVLQNGESFVF